MSEQQNVKVFKKIKVKKAVQQPASPSPEIPVHEEISNLIEENFDLPETSTSANEAPTLTIRESNDDDEFERLLNDFISSELDAVETEIEQLKSGETPSEEEKFIPQLPSESIENLNEEENALYQAYINFADAIALIAEENSLNAPDFKVTTSMLAPRYRPSIGKKIAEDALTGWDIILKVHPLHTLNISPNANDEDLLDFAEKTTDDTLQLAIISYVEILIEMEGCEISYDERRLKAQRKKIEKEIYQEHQDRINRINKYIKAIEEKKFPINAERLVNNYFKTAQKDPDGAYQVLTKNPAVFAPIDVSKIPPRFFGMIKPTPQDGIRVNIEIGEFIRKLKI